MSREDYIAQLQADNKSLEDAVKVLEAKVAELTKPKEPVYKTHEEYFATITKEIEELTPPNGDLKERE